MLMPCHRLFFALKPPKREAARIGRVRDRLKSTAGIVDDDRLHATLAITDDFADFPERLARTLVGIGDEVAGAPFPVMLDRLVGSARSVALRPGKASPPLRDVQRQLQGPMERLRTLRAGWSFSPHVTLVYRDGAPFNERIETIAWEGSEFVLIHSIVGRTRHIELARWPLVPRQYSLALH